MEESAEDFYTDKKDKEKDDGECKKLCVKLPIHGNKDI